MHDPRRRLHVAGHRPRRLSKGRKVLLTRDHDAHDPKTASRRPGRRIRRDGRLPPLRAAPAAGGQDPARTGCLAAVPRNGRVIGGMTAGADRSGDATFALTASWEEGRDAANIGPSPPSADQSASTGIYATSVPCNRPFSRGTYPRRQLRNVVHGEARGHRRLDGSRRCAGDHRGERPERLADQTSQRDPGGCTRHGPGRGQSANVPQSRGKGLERAAMEEHPQPGQAFMSALVTDHVVLQSARSTTTSEAVRRSAVYLTCVSSPWSPSGSSPPPLTAWRRCWQPSYPPCSSWVSSPCQRGRRLAARCRRRTAGGGRHRRRRRDLAGVRPAHAVGVSPPPASDGMTPSLVRPARACSSTASAMGDREGD